MISLTALEMESLGVLILRNETYGLEVMRLLNEGRKRYGLDEVSYGSFYAVLKRLEKLGLLESRWGDENDKSSGGARRRYYQVSSDGKSTFQANAAYRDWLAQQDRSSGQLQPEGI